MSVHTSPDCGTNRQYVFRGRRGQQVIRFRVKAPHNANLCLTTAPQETPGSIMYEIFLGGWNGQQSAIRKNKKQELCKAKTPNLLNNNEFRGFWVSLSSDAIKVGRENETSPFLVHNDASRKVLNITHYGFCTAYGAKGAWTFSDDDPTVFEPGTGSNFGQLPPAGFPSQPLPPTMPPQPTYPVQPPQPTFPGFPPQPTYPGLPPQPTYPGLPPQPTYPGLPPQPTYPGLPPQPTYPGQPTPNFPGQQLPPSYPSSSPNPSLPVSWVLCSGGLQCSAPVAAGPGPNPPLVATAHHQGGLIPGIFYSHSNACHVSWGGVAHVKHEYYLLSNNGGAELDWVTSSGGQVPIGAVQGGKSETGEALYVGRVRIGAAYVCGKVHPSHRQCYVANCGAEKGYSSYEVLCLNKVPLGQLGVE
ncbi:hypothetical protein Pmani_027083 [Petrolisthes manimaculis]|uniref:Farnesoic acid O-methyl transferase domain-containing protein n=1 Tax=Petrolisthes manimaculis TaxID=1843537 RepID=A0AAE1P2C7_9EUCA|nr:hypothetical protein Pmani_027083 [Petrolisthes manimaculis]